MSVAKVVRVEKSRKDQGKCGHCGDELPAGSGYVWWKMGFRSNYKHKRCLKAVCFPKPSERESNKTATILAAQESFEMQIDNINDKEEIESLVQEVGSAVREVAEEYREAADAWEQGNSELEEKADHYEGQADESENWESDKGEEPELCEKHEEEGDQDKAANCEDCQEKREEWIQEIRDEATEVVNNIEFM